MVAAARRSGDCGAGYRRRQEDFEFTISATAPTGPSNKDLWWDTIRDGRRWAEGSRGSGSWVSVVDPRVSPWARLASPSGFAPISLAAARTLARRSARVGSSASAPSQHAMLAS